MIRRWGFIFTFVTTSSGTWFRQAGNTGNAERSFANELNDDAFCHTSSSADIDDASQFLSDEEGGYALKLLQLAANRRQLIVPHSRDMHHRLTSDKVDFNSDLYAKSDAALMGGNEGFATDMLTQRIQSSSDASVKLQERASEARERLRDIVQSDLKTDEHKRVQNALLASLNEADAQQALKPVLYVRDNVAHTGQSQQSGQEDPQRTDLQEDLLEEIQHSDQLEVELRHELEYVNELQDELVKQREHMHELESELGIEPHEQDQEQDASHQPVQPDEEQPDEEDGHGREEELEHVHEQQVENELESELGHELDPDREHEIRRELDDVLAHDQLEREREEDQAREHQEHQDEEQRERELEDELVHEQDERERVEIRRELEGVLSRERDREACADCEVEAEHQQREDRVERESSHEHVGQSDDELEHELEDVLANGEESEHGRGGRRARDEALRHRLEDELMREHDERKHDELQHELDDVLEREHERQEHDEDADVVSRQLCLPQNALNFSASLVSHSNLGGAGPDDGDETLVYESVFSKNGMPVDLVISAASEYIPGESGKNGMHGGVFGLVNLRVDSHVDLMFRFIDRAGDPVEFGPFYFTFFDIDQGMAHGSRKSITAHGLSDFKLDEHTELSLEYLDDTSVKFMSTERGNREDNPSNPSTLTREAAQRTVTLIYPEVSEFFISLEEANYADPSHGRNFLFSGPSSMVCGKDHTCMHFDCPHDYHLRTMAEFLLCSDQHCTASDRDTCCYKENREAI